jgi:transposase
MNCPTLNGRSWRLAGVWDRIMDALAAGHDPTVEMIDTCIVRVHLRGARIAENNQQDVPFTLPCPFRSIRKLSDALR